MTIPEPSLPQGASMECQSARNESNRGFVDTQTATGIVGIAALILGATFLPTDAQAGSESNDATEAMSNLTEEVRRLSSDTQTSEIGRGAYEPLDRWEAPPTLAGPLFSIKTVYQLADQAPIVSTDLGPGLRLGAVTPNPGKQLSLLQNIIVGPNYAAISLGMQ